MPIEPNPCLKTTYVGNSSSDHAYGVPFRFDDPSHLVVVKDDRAGHAVVLEEGIGYTLAGNGGEATATVVVSPAVGADHWLTISRNAPGEQELDLASGSNPVPAVALTGALDRLAEAIQDAHPNLGEPFSAALTFPVSEPIHGDGRTLPQLPDRFLRRDGLLAFDESGAPVVLKKADLIDEVGTLATNGGLLAVTDTGAGVPVKASFSGGTLALRTIKGSAPDVAPGSTAPPPLQIEVRVAVDDNGEIVISAYVPDSGPLA